MVTVLGYNFMHGSRIADYPALALELPAEQTIFYVCGTMLSNPPTPTPLGTAGTML